MFVKETMDQFGSIHKCQEINGQRFSTIFDGEILRNVPTVKIRQEDVLICGFPRSGTNWTWEMIHMLLRGKAETIPMWKGKEMFEFTSSEEMDSHPSPRVLNTHIHYNNLPKDIHKLQNRIVYVIRNPKDAIVSFYNLYKKIKVDYNGSFEGYLQLHNDDELHFGSWFNHIIDWTNVIENELHKDVLVVYYEDTIENPLSTIERLAEFLGVEHNPELFSAVCKKCEFDRMALDKKDYTLSIEGEDVMFRKGVVGDWKNWFTVAQSEHFDRLMKEKLPDNKFVGRYVNQDVN